MKTFNSITSIVLIIAVAFLFWKNYGATPSSGTSSEQSADASLDAPETNGLRIAYVNTDSLIEKYDYHRELRQKLEVRAKALEQDLARKSKVFQENVNMLQQQADQMSEEQLQAAQLDLQQSQQRLVTYRDEKAEELASEEQELTRLIQEDLDDILGNLRQEHNIDFIMSYDPASDLLVANDEYDITKMVAERLNEKHANKKMKKDTTQSTK
ncbi:MAG: OmpH family outer membrane protein [Owenweeksia sp.]|nr:OmpH family outer membrane protein [Owenweeksia sp.]